eukprot:COSAG03_NODE_2076_length_3153_cov_2.302554_1_plen_27_part_10
MAISTGPSGPQWGSTNSSARAECSTIA